ncbi:hypothetical protein QR680_003937 [Steinernema hermaphroditum]|uniref:BTB domain-containing protein n=1 Tax=Steinernema hermaphroditum TaxID=289476 RepID=A0AA39LSY3_9BILA|nr:hypothetical protein QR680_003937 [Steinernema hermaphroditum]
MSRSHLFQVSLYDDFLNTKELVTPGVTIDDLPLCLRCAYEDESESLIVTLWIGLDGEPIVFAADIAHTIIVTSHAGTLLEKRSDVTSASQYGLITTALGNYTQNIQGGLNVSYFFQVGRSKVFLVDRPSSFMDTKLVFDDGTDMYVPKALLCSQSPVLDNIFREDREEYRIRGVKEEIFRILLHYFFGIPARPLDRDVRNTLRLAHKLKCETALLAIEQDLLNRKDPKKWFEIADRYGLTALVQRIVNLWTVEEAKQVNAVNDCTTKYTPITVQLIMNKLVSS